MTDDKIALMAQKVIIRAMEKVYQRKLNHVEYNALRSIGIRFTSVEFASQDMFTVCRIEIEGASRPYFGITRCSPQDTFDDGIGDAIALNRALHSWIAEDFDMLPAAIITTNIARARGSGCK